MNFLKTSFPKLCAYFGDAANAQSVAVLSEEDVSALRGRLRMLGCVSKFLNRYALPLLAMLVVGVTLFAYPYLLPSAALSLKAGVHPEVLAASLAFSLGVMAVVVALMLDLSVRTVLLKSHLQVVEWMEPLSTLPGGHVELVRLSDKTPEGAKYLQELRANPRKALVLDLACLGELTRSIERVQLLKRDGDIEASFAVAAV